MTLSEINSKISFLTTTDPSSGDFPNSDRIIILNEYVSKIVNRILRSQDEMDFDDKSNANFNILTADLVANQRDYGLPTDLLDIKRLQVTYDGSNWKKMFPLDINETSNAINNESDERFSTANPFYDVQANSIFLYPKPTTNVTGGLEIWISREFTKYVEGDLSTATEPGFDSLFHDILAFGVSFEYMLKNSKPQAANYKKIIDERMMELESHYGRKQKDRAYVVNPPYVDYHSGRAGKPGSSFTSRRRY